MIKALVEQHVDDTSNDFAVQKTADKFKDYAKSYFAGTVAAGIAYLVMIKDGYTWSDHFENVGGGNPNATRSPDFVFARAGKSDVALVESKGTRNASSGRFDNTVGKGYTRQVAPHLGFTVGTSTATHGYCIGAHLKSITKGELNVHYTDVVRVTPATGPTTGPGTAAAVQRHNYATAFRLAHSGALSNEVRQGRIEDDELEFLYFEWLGRRWLTAQAPSPSWLPRLAPPVHESWRVNVETWLWNLPVFAVESSRALQIFRTLSRFPEHTDVPFDIAPVDPDLLQQARAEGDGGAAIFPDGLAAITRRNLIKEMHPIKWSRHKPDKMEGRW
jgi:hypothetical protein